MCLYSPYKTFDIRGENTCGVDLMNCHTCCYQIVMYSKLYNGADMQDIFQCETSDKNMPCEVE